MRVGFNPNKDQPTEKSNYNHQVIVPVYIPNQENYFKDSFQILQYCLESLFKTSHSKTYFTVVNNGSCEVVKNYLNLLQTENKIHEVIHTTDIGKLNAVLKGITGHQFPLLTITDADVLFLNDWQKATYEVLEAFPKAGAICAAPSSKVLKQSTSSLIVPYLFSAKLSFTKVVNPKAMQMFATSIGAPEFYSKTHLEKYLTIKKKKIEAVVGAGHFMTTYRGEIFDALNARFSPYALGGTSEGKLLDEPVNDLGYWRLATADNYVLHLGNVVESWMQYEVDTQKKCEDLEVFLRVDNKEIPSRNWAVLNKIIFSFVVRKPIWKLFLRYKGLTKEEAQNY